MKNNYVAEHRKQITFDLNQKALAEHYPKPKDNLNPQFYKRAYTDIRQFMERFGFEHRQYSVYTSVDNLTDTKVAAIMQRIAKEMPWLSECVNQIDVTNIGKQYSLLDTLREATVSYREELEHEQQHSRSAERDELSMDPIMAKLNPIEKKQEQEHTRDEEDWIY